MADFVVLGGAIGAGFGLLEAVAQYALAPDAVVRGIDGGCWKQLAGGPC